MNFKPPSFFMQAMAPVVAQLDMKRKLAFAFSNYSLFLDDPTVNRPTPLVYGPSGSGKTFGVELCCEASGLPFTVIGGGGLSSAGYKGITLRDLLAQHYLRFRCSEGIIFIDEIDKWCRAGMMGADSEQLALGSGKMGEILRYVEREDIWLQDEAKDIAALREPDPDAEETDEDVAWLPVKFETRRAMWVLAGAFEKLSLIIKARMLTETLMDESQLWEKAAPVDFRNYGMLQELVNRCDTPAFVKPLKGHEIIRVLEEQEVPRMTKLFAAIGCRLTLDPGALARASHLAVQERTGARGAILRLRHVIADCFVEAEEHGMTSCTIDTAVLDNGHLPIPAAKAGSTLHVVPCKTPERAQPSLAPLASLAAVAAV